MFMMVAQVPDNDSNTDAQPDPFAADAHTELGPHLLFRYILGAVLLIGLLTCVVLGIYRVIEALNQTN